MKINKKYLRYLFIIISIAIMILIFSFSSQKAVDSSKTSGRFVELILKVFVKDFENLEESISRSMRSSLQHFVRKAAHFLIYALLGLFVNLSALTFAGGRLRYVVSACLCILYAAGDEYHQTFIYGRSGQISDVLLDFFGSCLGIILSITLVYIVLLLYNQYNNRGKQKGQV